MDLTGETTIDAPPDVVWAALIDPVTLSRLIPGCESMTGSPEAGYDITVARGLGGMTARLSGRVEMADVRPGQGCNLTARGTGGAAGLARGTATIRLVPAAGGTRLAWVIGAEVGGRLASLPRMVLDLAARRLADGFVIRFTAAVEGRPVAKGWFGRLAGG